MSYAGDVSVTEAWEILATDPASQLVDVRTAPEWSFAGRPDMRPIGKTLVLQSWQIYPQMAIDAEFVEKLERQLGQSSKSAPILFLCRSGARSRAAAIAMTSAGFSHCYNIAGGFEGDRDSAGHRNSTGGWRFAGLPWIQD